MAKHSGVRITDIAQAAGVSITTVSRILRQDRALKISEETRARVLAAAERLGYEPNLFAAALRSQRTGLIGALSPNLAGTFLPLLTQELQRAARARGIELLIATPEADSEQMAAQLHKLQGMLFDGLLLLGDVLDYQAAMRRLQVLKKPYVSVCAGAHAPGPLVNMDDAAAMHMAVDYLRGLGHWRIAFLGSTRWNQERDRLLHFQAEMAAAGLPVRAEYLAVMEHNTYNPLAADFQAMWTREPLAAAQALLRLPEPPTALVCANDGFAVAALKGALLMGKRAPDDISIIGHNDELISALYHPELTTVRQPLAEMAALALDLLLARLDGVVGADEAARHLLPPTLVVCGSCVPPA